MEQVMFFTTKAFWKDAVERAVSTAAQSALTVVGVDILVDAVKVPWPYVGSVAAGGAALALLKALAMGAKVQAKSGGDIE